MLGGDTFIVTGGGGSDSPLVIYGDTSQDGSRYDSIPGDGTITGNAIVFDHSGHDVIDASASAPGITVFGGAGDDTIIGSQAGDHLAGGSGDDTISGQAGVDHIYGDSGFNVDLPTRELTVPTSNSSTTDNHDPLVAGTDTIHGDADDDIIIGSVSQAGLKYFRNDGGLLGPFVQQADITFKEGGAAHGAVADFDLEIVSKDFVTSFLTEK